MEPIDLKKLIADLLYNVNLEEALKAGFFEAPLNTSEYLVGIKGYKPKYGRDSLNRVLQNIDEQLSGIANQINRLGTRPYNDTEDVPPPVPFDGGFGPDIGI